MDLLTAIRWTVVIWFWMGMGSLLTLIAINFWGLVDHWKFKGGDEDDLDTEKRLNASHRRES